jgi:ligand-binding sensor domain-containing protein
MQLLPARDRFVDHSANVPLGDSAGDITVDRSGRLWVPGVDWIAVREGERWSRIDEDHGLPTALSQSVFEDRESNVWIGGTGIHRLLGRGAFSYYTRKNGLPSSAVWSIRRDRLGTLWVGTQNGIAYMDENGLHTLEGVSGHERYSIAADSQGLLYVPDYPAGIDVIDPATKVVSQLTVPDGVLGERILRLAVDRKDRIWIGSRTAGLVVGERRRGAWTFERVTLPDADAKTASVRTIWFDPKGRVWAAMGQHVHYLDEAGWHVLAGTRGEVMSGFSTASGAVFLAYEAGLEKWVEDGGHYAVQNRWQGHALASAPVYIITEDARGHAWAATDGALFRLDEDRIAKFDTSDGLPTTNFDSKTFWADPNGDMWLGTAA